MRRNSVQPSLDLFAPPSRPTPAGRAAGQFTPWPLERRESEVAQAVAEALASLLHLCEDRTVAERLPRLFETAVLASAAGPSGTELLEQVDRALVRARGKDHGLLDGKYL